MKSFEALRAAFAVGAVALAQAAAADPVHITAQSTVDTIVGGSAQYMPLGTTVSLDFYVDIAGTPSGAPVFTAISGQVTWNDGVDRLFTASTTGNLSYNSAGRVLFTFGGSGPTIDGQTSTTMGLGLMVSENPFNTTLDWADLFLGATVTAFRLGVHYEDGTGYEGNVGAATGSITAVQDANGVPEPATLALVSLAGLAGLAARRRPLQA